MIAVAVVNKMKGSVKKNMANVDIKVALKKANMKQWELAELLEMSEFTLSRKMRRELPESEKIKIMDLISGNSQKGIA